MRTLPALALLAACLDLGASAQSSMPMDHMAGMEEHAHAPSKPSTSLALTVDGKTTTYTLADLQAMPQKTVTAKNGHTGKDETYTGVLFSDLLAKFGFDLNKDAKHIYHSYLKAEGTDRYWVLYSVSEVWGAMHTGDTIVALTLDGAPLTEDGQFKLVSSDDKRPARWVRNLTSITVSTLP